MDLGRDVGMVRNVHIPDQQSKAITHCFCYLQACRENHVDVVELLLDYGASVNAPFPNSRCVKHIV